MQMQIFAQLSKVDIEKRLVYGQAVQETPDHSGEIMDYALSKPNFQKWSDTVKADTNGASLGNVRAMHSNIAAGKVTDIIFNDSSLSIDIVAKIVDTNEWEKVLEGVYTGFSMGGRYGKTWKDGELTRYEAIPSEISLVDRPCIPTAKFFQIQKADGTMTEQAFKDGEAVAPETSEIAKVYETNAPEIEGTEQDLEALARIMKSRGYVMGDVVKVLRDMKKSLWDVHHALDVLQGAKYLLMNLKLDALEDGDNEDVAIVTKANEAVAILGELITMLVADEVGELNETEPATEDDTMQMADIALGLCKAGARNSRADAETIQKMHDYALRLGAVCAEPASVTESVGTEKIEAADMNKSVLDAVAPMAKMIEELAAQVAALKNEPLPAKGILKVVTKAQDATPAHDQQPAEVAPILKADGTIDEMATGVKKAQMSARNLI